MEEDIKEEIVAATGVEVGTEEVVEVEAAGKEIGFVLTLGSFFFFIDLMTIRVS